MASVTFPPELGGDGSTVTDDDNPATGLGNDGHRERFIPALKNAVAVTGNAKDSAAQARSDRLTATSAAAQAVSAKGAAEKAASTATQAAAAATASAQEAAGTYPSVAQGLGATTADQYFKVPENGYLQLYRNSNGAAEPIFKLASQESLVKLSAQPDPLLTSLIF
ncbi:hypothetical protein [Stutzerimonas xanthomarina]|uniref:hypothetical protein n=1 Tax=Stutzerimonas xanthomarina TaxID=271420 RepID=UPI003AA885C1